MASVAQESMRPLAHRGLLVPIVGGMALLAWAALWAWDRTPYARYINHADICTLRVADGWQISINEGLLYVAGWILMTIAMMLPTTLPLLEIFRRLTRNRSDRTRLIALVIAGYLTAWLAFGIAAHAVDLALHDLFDRGAWLKASSWAFGAATLVLAGAFQFSRLKHRCLDKCRAPLSFVLQHWTGGAPGAQALRLGLHHGAYCVGCCWALMLLMFAVGTGNLGWMVALGAVMAVEKNVAWGRQLSTPLGVGLIAWGALIVLQHTAT